MQVNAISFVADYCEVLFDGPILRALAHPYGESDGREWRVPQPGAMDAMRNYIGKTVASVEDRPHERVGFETTDGSTFVIPLVSDERVGAEGAHLVPNGPDGSPDATWMRTWETALRCRYVLVGGRPRHTP